MQAAIAKLEELGAEVEECSLPLSVEYGMPCYYLIAPAEASSNLARYDGVRYGYPRRRRRSGSRCTSARATRASATSRSGGSCVGTYALSAGYYDAYYGQAQKVRTVIKREHDALFETFDALVSPTSPTVAFPLGARTADPIAMYLSDLLTIPSCMAGLPGLNVPCGLSEGLPVGLQLVGPQFAENTLFRDRPRARAGDRLRPRPGAARDDVPLRGSRGGVRARGRARLRRAAARARRLARRPRRRREAPARGGRARALADRDARPRSSTGCAMVQVREDIEEALREAKEKLDERG